MAENLKSGEKTNVMRILDSRKIPYDYYTCQPDPGLTGAQIAGLLNKEAGMMFKTLVTKGKSGRYYVFVIPVTDELELKKAAKATDEKYVEMIHQKELLPLTGYVHGGCSPIGMKKAFPVFLHSTAESLDRICVSAGKVGWQIELKPADLQRVVSYRSADLV